MISPSPTLPICLPQIHTKPKQFTGNESEPKQMTNKRICVSITKQYKQIAMESILSIAFALALPCLAQVYRGARSVACIINEICEPSGFETQSKTITLLLALVE